MILDVEASLGSPENLERRLRDVCRDMSLDAMSFQTIYHVSIDSFVETCRHTFEHGDPATDRSAYGLLAFVGSAVMESAALASAGRGYADDFIENMRRIFGDPGVRDLFRRVFSPRPTDPDADITLVREAQRSWEHEHIDWETLTFWKCGTTSMLFRGSTKIGYPHPVVVKVVHQLFQGLDAVRHDTRDYSTHANEARKACRNVVEVIASWESFIVSELIEGETLGEYLARRIDVEPPGSDEVLGIVEDVIIPLCVALESLHQHGPHSDLVPSNVLIQTDKVPSDIAVGGMAIRFVDLGRNYLASQQIGRVRSAETDFVAPEVRAAPPESGTAIRIEADLYSVGMLLVRVLGADRDDIEAGRVPDLAFRASPLLARLLIDLTDPDPPRRLLIPRRDWREEQSFTLSGYLKKLALCLHADEASVGARSLRKILRQVVDPTFVTLKAGTRELWRLWGTGLASMPGYLAHFRAIALVALGVSLAALGLAVVYDYGGGYHHFAPITDGVASLLDGVGFPTGKRSERTQAKVVGVSFAVAAYYYYRVVFGEMSLRRARPARLGFATEVLNRTMTVVTLPFVILGNLTWPGMWLWFSAMGMGAVGLNNVLSHRRQARVAAAALEAMVRRGTDEHVARGLLSDDSAGLSSSRLESWATSMPLFALAVFALAAATTWGNAQDLWVYAIALTAANIYLAWSQSIRAGAGIRVSLARTAAYGEREAT